MSVRWLVRRWSLWMLVLVVAGGVACRKRPEPAPPVATPTLTINTARAPLGSPIELTYKFAVAADAKLDQDYKVMVHFLNADEELMWTDDHMPPVPTSTWKPGQVIEYTRTLFIPPNYPYNGDSQILIGLYTPATNKRLPLAAEDFGQRAYRIAKLQILPSSENLELIFKDGWQPTEAADNNKDVVWQWTKKVATIQFRNPKRDATFYLDVDAPGGIFQQTQQVEVRIGDAGVDTFSIAPKQAVIRAIPIKADQLGTGDMSELTLDVDKTFVPSAVPGSGSRDSRELGVRVFHAYVAAR